MQALDEATLGAALESLYGEDYFYKAVQQNALYAPIEIRPYYAALVQRIEVHRRKAVLLQHANAAMQRGWYRTATQRPHDIRSM